MTLINAIDLAIAQTEKSIKINADNGAAAFADGDLNYHEKIRRFGKQLNILHSKFIVARAEITNLSIHGCDAVRDDRKWEELP